MYSGLSERAATSCPAADVQTSRLKPGARLASPTKNRGPGLLPARGAFDVTSHLVSLQQQGRLPAHALRVGLQLLQGAILNLTHPLLRNTQQMTDLPEAVGAVTRESEAEV